MRGAVLIVFALAAVALAGCGGSEGSTDSARGDVVELTRIDQLRTAFEADRGKPRLVLLLSPT